MLTNSDCCYSDISTLNLPLTCQLYSLGGDGNLRVIDTLTNTISSTLDLSTFSLASSSISIDSLSNILYVTSGGTGGNIDVDHYIIIIDSVDNSISNTFLATTATTGGGGIYPHKVISYNNKLYILGAKMIQIYDKSTFSLLSEIQPSLSTFQILYDMVLNTNNNTGYTSSWQANQIDIFDLDSYVITNSITINDQPTFMSLDTATNLVYIYCRSNNTIKIINSSGTIVNTINIGESVNNMLLDIDNRIGYLVMTASPPRIKTIDLSSQTLTNTTITIPYSGSVPNLGYMSFNGLIHKLYITDTNHSTIFVVDTNTNEALTSINGISSSLDIKVGNCLRA